MRFLELLAAAGVGALTTYYWLAKTGKGKLGARAASYHAGMCQLKPEMKEQYMQLHDHTWDEVMMRMYECNMRDFTVWLHEVKMI